MTPPPAVSDAEVEQMIVDFSVAWHFGKSLPLSAESSGNVANMLRALLRDRQTAEARSAAGGSLRSMVDAPKDGRQVLVRFRTDIPESIPFGISHHGGSWMVVRHAGFCDGHDMGWGFPGNGGLPDRFFQGWLPLDEERASTPAALASLLAAAREEGRAAEEKSPDNTMDQRDQAEDAVNRMYLAVMGEHPQWSNQFSFHDAVEAVEERVAEECAAARADALREARELVEGLVESVEALLGTCVVLRGRDHDEADFYQHEEWAEKDLEKEVSAARTWLLQNPTPPAGGASDAE